ncbi:hypothetical protein, partial [uncultured Phascolarctobacterium sp.]|uniref:hypothetical protein n=1 Tax=uncultured Phascolarctobacterium sp. TaxID=512296 RepID=UPI00261AE1E2
AKRSCKKSTRFSKRGKESLTFIYSSHFVTRFAQSVVFGASGSRLFRLAMQSFGGLPQSVNLLLACERHGNASNAAFLTGKKSS